MIEIPFNITEVEPESFHCILIGECLHKPLHLILDTGASRSVIHKELGELFFVGDDKPKAQNSHSLNSEITEYGMVHVPEIKFGPIVIKELSFTLIDLTYLNTIYLQHAGHRIDGLLGGDFFMRYKAVIDYKRMLLVLTR